MMGRFKTLLEGLSGFGSKDEADIYGKDLPEKPEIIAGRVVLPDAKDINIEDIATVFAGDGYKGPGLNLGRVGDVINKSMDDFNDLEFLTGDLLNNIKAQNKELFEHARRKSMTLEEMVELAERQGFNGISQKLLTRKPGDMLKAEDMVAGFILLKKLSQEMALGAKQVLNLPEFIGNEKVVEDYEKIQRLAQIYTHLTAQISGGASEAGRTLGVVSHIEKVLDIDTQTMGEEIENLASKTVADMMTQNDVKKIKYELTNLAALDFRSKDQYIKGSVLHVGKKTMDVMMEMYINSLLSSPVTHTVNVAGNAVFQMTRFAETGVAGLVGKARTSLGFGNQQDRALLIDSMAFMHGSLMAQKQAMTLMLKTAITGESGDLITKIDLKDLGIGSTNNIVEVMEQASKGDFGSAFINTMGIATRLPGRFLAMEDEYFKVMIKKRVQYQEAYRASHFSYEKAIGAGMNKDEAERLAKQAYIEVMTNPTKEVSKRMSETALKETFQAPIQGDRFNAVFNNHIVKILGVPFYKTPTNIFKEIGDRTINIYPTAKALMKGEGREFDEAFAKLITGWGIMSTAVALTSGYYGDDIIITGTGPGNQKARDIINKGANIPPTSIGVKQDDGSYKFYSFNRFDPLSMLLVAAADYNNFAEYNPDSDQLEKLLNVLTLASTEYASSIPFMQGFAEFSNMIGDRYESGETRGARIAKWLGSRTAGFATSIGGQAETFTSLGGVSLMRKVGIDVPFIGSNSFSATLERIGDPYKSNTMLTEEQLKTDRIEDISSFWLGFYETLNKARARHPLFSEGMYDDVNFWGEPIMQMDPVQLRKNGKLIQSFNPVRIQNGAYTPLDEELMRLSQGGFGTFSLHKRSQKGYKLTGPEYLDYVYYVNNVDDNGNMPEDDLYNADETLLNSLNGFLDVDTKDGDDYIMASDEEKYQMLSSVLADKRNFAREKIFSSGRLQTIYQMDNPDE